MRQKGGYKGEKSWRYRVPENWQSGASPLMHETIQECQLLRHNALCNHLKFCLEQEKCCQSVSEFWLTYFPYCDQMSKGNISDTIHLMSESAHCLSDGRFQIFNQSSLILNSLSLAMMFNTIMILVMKSWKSDPTEFKTSEDVSWTLISASTIIGNSLGRPLWWIDLWNLYVNGPSFEPCKLVVLISLWSWACVCTFMRVCGTSKHLPRKSILGLHQLFIELLQPEIYQ